VAAAVYDRESGFWKKTRLSIEPEGSRVGSSFAKWRSNYPIMSLFRSPSEIPALYSRLSDRAPAGSASARGDHGIACGRVARRHPPSWPIYVLRPICRKAD